MSNSSDFSKDAKPFNGLITRARHFIDFPKYFQERGQLSPVVYPHINDNTFNVHLIVDMDVEMSIINDFGIKIDARKYDNLCRYAIDRWISDQVQFEIITKYYAADHEGDRNASEKNEALFKKLEYLKFNGWEVYNSRSPEITFGWISTRIANIASFAKYVGGKHVIILLGNDIAYADALHDAIFINEGNVLGYVMHGSEVSQFLIAPEHLKRNHNIYDCLHSVRIDRKIAKMLQMDFNKTKSDE